MLKYIRINNIAVVKEVRLELGAGLTLFTGETGAGKSILVDALGLLLGSRGSAELVRTGEATASVEGLFESVAAAAWLEERDLPSEGSEVIVRREVGAAGKGRATVNGALVPLATLRELAPELAIIHGQHEPHGLLDPATHAALLDGYAGLGDLRESVGRLHGAAHEAEGALREHRVARAADAARRAELATRIADVDQLGVQAGEEQALRSERQRLAQGERLQVLAGEAYGALYEDEGAVVTRLRHVFKRLEELGRIDTVAAPLIAGRDGLEAQVQDLARSLGDYVAGLEAQPGRLDEVETRLAALERLRKRHGAVTLEALIEQVREDRARLGDAEAEEEEARLAQAEEVARRAWQAEAKRLSEARRASAVRLQSQLAASLADLAMPKARVQVAFHPAPAVSTLETVEFLISPNPGEDVRPLARIASGGELSRVALALKALSIPPTEGLTLVFDEVDAGIGGRVAEVVGRQLQAIARHSQVLCVSHLPQIAALADTQIVVRKTTEGGRTVVDTEPVAGDARVDEIARMLAGETVSEAARRHAREMIAAGQPR